MGACLTWFATKGKKSEVVCAELGLRNTGQRVVTPWRHIVGAELPDGRYLIQRPRYECRDDEIPARLSVGCEVISLFVEEHVMFSRVSSWKDGKRLWSVIHKSEERDDHLEMEGALPLEFSSIRDQISAERGQTPFFEIPCKLAAKLTGYRYDAPAKEQISGFVVLALPPWWKRLFAGGPSL